MKSACFIPIKSYSSRLSKKNRSDMCGRMLFEFALNKVIDSGAFDDIFVDTDCEVVKRYISNIKKIKLIERQPHLSRDDANGNDLLNYWYNLYPDYDVYFQVFVTSPFIKKSTINDCMSILVKGNEYDSVLTAIKEQAFFWHNNRPLNYDPKVLPRTQDCEVIKETTSLYAIKNKALKEMKCRIGKNPFFYFVDEIEAIDINAKFDLSIAKLINDNLLGES